MSHEYKQPSTYITSPPADVGSPKHYTQGTIEAIDYIKASMTKEQYEGFLLGNVKKYTHRYKYKGEPVKDLLKASWYLERLIKEVRDAT